jgi:predicted nucleotidyltransferase component of viral defense system
LLPQRQISKLANRLYLEAIDKVGKKSARRIPEDVIERDYVLAWLLTQIPTNALLSEALTFKGGTALRRMHFGEYRFSEDLDFTLTREVPLEDLFAAFDSVFETLLKVSGISMSRDEKDVTRHVRNDTFYFNYQGPLPAPKRVKVDVTRGETIVFPLEAKRVLKTYEEYADLPCDGAPLSVYSLHEIVVEKTLAVTDGARREPRDLYDLWFILSENHLQHPEEVIAGLNQKLASREGRAEDVLSTRLERVEAVLRKGWETRLGLQVDMLPGFEGCFRDVKKLMNDFDRLRAADIGKSPRR